MLDKIWNILKKPKAQRNILAVALIVVIILLRGCDGSSDIDVYKYEQNISALQDSVRTYKNKNDDLVYEKLAYIASEKELAKYNKELKDEVSYLKDNPITVTKYITRIVHDTVRVPVYIDTTNITWNADSTIKYIPFEWDNDTTYNENNYRKLGGNFIVAVDTTMNGSINDFEITNDEIGLSFTTGLTENSNDQVEIFITSDYPGFVPTAIEGALFDPRESTVIKKFFPPKRWAVGVYGGYGFYFDPSNTKFGSGIQLGVGIQYNLFQWNGKK